MQSLAPLVLKTTHGWGESGVARLFKACPLSSLSSLSPEARFRPQPSRPATQTPDPDPNPQL